MLGLGLGLARAPTLSVRGGTALDRILGAGGRDYAFWDAAFRDGMFSEPVGPTPAVASGDAPGLWIDIGRRKRRPLASVLAGSPQLMTNAGFAGGLSGWTTVNGASVQLGDGWVRVSTTADGAAGRLRQVFPTEVGALYAVTFQSREGTGGRPILRVMTVDGGSTSTLSYVSKIDGIETVYFVSTDAVNTRVMLYAPGTALGNYADFRFCEVRRVPGRFGIQPTAGYKPVLQATGLKFDGIDDNLMTDWCAQAGANCILAHIDLPTGPGIDQFISGSQGPAATDRFRIGVQAGTGKVLTGLGTQIATATSGPDVRGTTAIVGLAFDGTTATVFVNDAVTNTFAQGGSQPNPTVPVCLGAVNINGTVTNWFSGAIRRIALGRVAPTLAQYLAIRAEWLQS